MDGSNPKVESAIALVRKPDGTQETLTLTANGENFSADYAPGQSGLHSVEVRLSGESADGFGFDRSAFLTFEVQPGKAQIDATRAVVIAALLVVLIAFLWLVRIARRRRKIAAR
jgi:hypothetical protein